MFRFDYYCEPPAADWTEKAACAQPQAQGVDFFSPHREEMTEAKKVCAQCPVMSECRSYALDTFQPIGIWGGLSLADRHKILNQHRNRNRRGPLS